MDEILKVQDLAIDYSGPLGLQRVVDRVSFVIRRGEIFGLVGESGSGKSTIVLAILGYTRAGGRFASGDISYLGKSVLELTPAQLCKLRGRSIGYVPQNPAGGLSPHMRVIDQIKELLLQYGAVTSSLEAETLALEQLKLVALPWPDVLARRYPHELSGGQQQRVCIALAIACKPDLLLLDEPTTGLDVTTQAKIVKLLAGLQTRLGVSMLYVTHDLGVLSQLTDRLGVMYAGHLVEAASTADFFRWPRHPYSQGLIRSIPSIGSRVQTTNILTGILRR